ncbi:MAG TPA: RNA polymerase subunit sigma-70 [Streptosporangiaceae bacterium]
MSTDLITRARAGDQQAFRELVEPHQRELQAHCYRMLGSAADAEDAVQETLLAAWRSLGGFEQRASMRTWLYRIATSRCLTALRSASRRPPVTTGFRFDTPAPSRLGEVPWLEPYPDLLLQDLPDTAADPQAHYEAREAISLAFVRALQLLPPRQRAALILRDVLSFHAREAASILGVSEQSVTSALKRARTTLASHIAPDGTQPAPPAPGSAVEHRLVAEFARSFQAGDVDGVVALLTKDAWLTMPPLPLEYQGRELAADFLTAVFRNASHQRRGRRPRPIERRLVSTRANGQPAFGLYLHDPHAAVLHANGLLVLTLAGHQISAITRFDNATLPWFGLPRSLLS